MTLKNYSNMINESNESDKLSKLLNNSNLNLSSQPIFRENEPFNLDIETLDNTENSSHYCCSKCFKFPYIKFCKDKKHIRLTCSCFNNKKVLIKELFEGNYLLFKNNYTNLLKTEFDINTNSNKVLCERHKEKFKAFSKLCQENYCQKCINEKPDNDIIIFFDDIKIENNIIEQFVKKINYVEESNTDNTTKYIQKNNDIYEILSTEEEIRFKNLVNIRIKDYKNYPNFSHFFNIRNLLSFFNIEDIPVIEDKEKISEHQIIKNDEPIIIEYNNNIYYKTKLFNKTFVRNNKQRFIIQIEEQKIDLIDEYKFKSIEKKVKIKLFVNNGVSEINMYKMFANCIDLISVDGISKLKIKIQNMNKMFYNCISLLSIPDFNEWEIKNFDAYLMFFNCIFLVFFHFENKFTRYLNKELIIGNINGDNEGFITLFENKYKIKNKEEEIMIFDGNDENELIACYKIKEVEDDNILILNKSIK